MGSHVCEKLANRGWDITVTTRRPRESGSPHISFAVGNAHDQVFLDCLLDSKWDAIVDFMVWSTAEFRERYKKLLSAAEQYVFTSSYRVYADSSVITEESPRLLDAVDDDEYLATDEYALSKARCENLLLAEPGCNWTIIRPAVTYDGAVGRLQLAVLESDEWLWRALHQISVPLPAAMLEKQSTMSWGGDVAEMISRLVGNSMALGEVFTVSGSDHMTWSQVADAYREVLPSLEVVPCELSEFERHRGGVYQIRYDRMFNRVIDNSKILSVTGMTQEGLKGMRETLPEELSLYLASEPSLPSRPGFQGKLDRLTGGVPSFAAVAATSGFVGASKYLVRRVLK